MKYFSVQWEVITADSRNRVLSVIKKAKNREEAILKSLEKFGGEYSRVELSKEDLDKKTVCSNTGICYEVPIELERAYELDVKKAICKNTGERRSVLIEADKKMRQLEGCFWTDGEPRYLATIKWTTYTDTGDIAAVHLYDLICHNSSIEEARYGILRILIQAVEKNRFISREQVRAMLTPPNYIYRKGLDEYEVVKVNPLELRTIELDGVRQECFVPSITNPEMPDRAILVTRSPHMK